MNEYERNDQATLPPQYRPLSPWAYFGYSILFGIPIIGLISLLILAFNQNNINRRNFARSYFCIYVLILILALLFGTSIATWFSTYHF